ncbi:MAG: hypothetical protein AAF633_06810, partial [Chloroflexota bacterium]
MGFKDVYFGAVEESPIDHLWVAMASNELVAVQFRGEEATFRQYVKRLTSLDPEFNPLKVAPAITQIQAYLRKERKEFTLPICWKVMTKFQKKVLSIVHEIPYGQIRT